MRKLFLVGTVIFLVSLSAVQAGETSSSEADYLSFEQKVTIAQIITHRTPPLTNVNFPIAINAIVPLGINLESFPPEAEAIAPQLHDLSYIVVEELIAIAEQRNRKIVIVIPRWG
jgi:hypothetical protein